MENIKTIAQLSELYMLRYNQNVDDWNDQTRYQHVSLETQLSFTNHQLNLAENTLVALMSILKDKEEADAKNIATKVFLTPQ